MPQVRYISSKDQIARGSDRVVIERTPSGKFWVSGSALESTGAIIYQTAVFETLERAIAEASAWANRKDVQIAHVLDCLEAKEPELAESAIST